jgi:hypothetical protein
MFGWLVLSDAQGMGVVETGWWWLDDHDEDDDNEEDAVTMVG